jgi:hypothetical protein
MFKWYEAATICYAYLEDVRPESWRQWQDSRWLTRGWTLQELIAPFEVVIYDYLWRQLGTKRRLTKELIEVTNIPEEVLLDAAVRHEKSVAERMSWAEGRNTTRIEDRAYCLLGLFDINMPLLYGEGDKSFSRLYEQILNTMQDDTVFLGGISHSDDGVYAFPPLLYDKPSNEICILITPDNIPSRLSTTVHPLPDAASKSHDATKLMTQLRTLGAITSGWQRKDPKLRGDILSMPMRIIQVTFSGQRPADVPITKKQQIRIDLDPGHQRALELEASAVQVEGGSLCIAMLRCGTEDGRLIARYFKCILVNDELRAYPLSVYRLCSPAEVGHWPDIQCHILINQGVWMPGPRLQFLRDVANWGSPPERVGAFGNGWSWKLKTDSEFPAFFLGVKGYTQVYQLCFGPSNQLWDLSIGLATRGEGTRTVIVSIQLRCSTDPMLRSPTVEVNHGRREGLVTELCHRMSVLGGSAELIISVYYGLDSRNSRDHLYSPMIRFRAFEASH